MKTIYSLITLGLLAGSCFAGGIEGRVVDGNGNPRKDIKVSVKGYRQSTTTNSDGYFVLEMPKESEKTRVNVYVDGNFAANCHVPEGKARSTVNVVLKRK